ncbi:MAG: hypothetical protein KAG99_02905, partial [Bacteroidales bacterium]|nr:hypothetical protein [Bacteroidales bacterium]
PSLKNENPPPQQANTIHSELITNNETNKIKATNALNKTTTNKNNLETDNNSYTQNHNSEESNQNTQKIDADEINPTPIPNNNPKNDFSDIEPVINTSQDNSQPVIPENESHFDQQILPGQQSDHTGQAIDMGYQPASYSIKFPSRLQPKMGLSTLHHSNASLFDYAKTPTSWPYTYSRKAEFSIGLFFAPELINYQRDTEKTKKSYYLDLLIDYHRNSFLLRSGLGMSLSEDNGNYAIDYETYDSIGYYYNITSFSVIPGDPDSIVFNTGVEGVYDSIDHNTVENPENHYFYINIPLLVGYKVLEHSRFSCTLMGGPVFSILIHENEHEVSFSDPEAISINIENNTPKRIKTNWQMMVTLGLHYKISNKMSFALEPTYRQYIKTVYNGNDQTKAPFSWGVRGGLIIAF